MDTSQEYKSLLEKKARGIPVTVRDIAVAIGNDKETLLKYMADNDFMQVYKLLHLSDSPMIIGANAAFVPSKKKVETELKSLLIRKNYKVLNQIIDHFVVNMKAGNYTSNQELIRALCDIQVLKSAPEGYEFNVNFS